MPLSNSSQAHTLCLAMIVRDEENNLREWLPEAANHVHEIVAVDTGSKDGTVAFLKSVGAKVYHQEWAEDFSLHRNYGLSNATADWVLILDADERLKRVHWFTLSSLLKNEDVMAYSFTVKNYHSTRDLSNYDTMKSYRLFRNHHDIKYTGAVHNQLAPGIQKACRHTGMITQHSYITIEHYGYALSGKAKEKKHERIYKMVKKQLEEKPEDEYYLFHKLSICLAMGKFSEARKAAAELEIDRLRPELRIQAYYKAAQVEMHFNMYQHARAYIRHALLIAPDASFLHYLLSNILYQMQRYSAGLRSAYRALDYARIKSNATTLIHLPLDECLCNVGLGYLLSMNYEQADEYFKQALAHNSENVLSPKYREWIRDKVEPSELTTQNKQPSDSTAITYPS